VHLCLELVEHLLVVKVGVSEQPVETAHYVVKMFCAASGNGNPRVEIVAILNYACGVVQRVDHVVDCRALLGLLVSRTHVQKSLIGCHFGTRFACTYTQQLNH